MMASFIEANNSFVFGGIQTMEIKNLFKYRIYWMGVAMLWVVLFHMGVPFSGLLKQIKTYGYAGVDIFLFASGIGNYYSYLKCKEPLTFLKRKITRLAPSYIPFIIIWLLVEILLEKVAPKAIIGNLLCIQGFTNNGGEFNWYLTAILVCYVLAPYLVSYVDCHGIKMNMLLIATLILASFAFWGDEKFIITATRIPIFVIGIIVARYGDCILTGKLKIASFVSFVIGFVALSFCAQYYVEGLWFKGLYWYPFILMTPFICMIISVIIGGIEKRKTLKGVLSPLLVVLSEVGKCSFEIFLIHIFFKDMAYYMITKYHYSNSEYIYIGVSIFSIIFAIAVKEIISKIVSIYSVSKA